MSGGEQPVGTSPVGDRATREPSPDGLGHSASVPSAVREKLNAERIEREARLVKWAIVEKQLGWIPVDQVWVDRNELILDDYLSREKGIHSYLEQVQLWEVGPGEGEPLRQAIILLPELLRHLTRDMMSDEERIQIGWRDLAQGIEAPTGGETGTGSTVGESPVGNADAPESNRHD